MSGSSAPAHGRGSSAVAGAWGSETGSASGDSSMGIPAATRTAAITATGSTGPRLAPRSSPSGPVSWILSRMLPASGPWRILKILRWSPSRSCTYSAIVLSSLPVSEHHLHDADRPVDVVPAAEPVVQALDVQLGDVDGAERAVGEPCSDVDAGGILQLLDLAVRGGGQLLRSEEHTSELQSRFDLVCRLL